MAALSEVLQWNSPKDTEENHNPQPELWVTDGIVSRYLQNRKLR
jgi:hypothetical protein